MNHGLILSRPVPKKDYVFGSSLRLGGTPLVPDGQWDAWIPADEVQNLGTEPMACTTFGTLNAVEILERQEFGETQNYSDRFLAKISGTTQAGNNPHKVAETLREKGVPQESDWPYTPEINTWEKFYAAIPQALYSLAIAFIAKFNFGHEYVGTDAQSMMDALQFSPLCLDVFAWGTPDAQGLYHREGQPSEHWVCCYGYVQGQYWKIFDSYTITHKKIAWDFGFSMVKRYTLHKQVVNETAFSQFLKWLRLAIGL